MINGDYGPYESCGCAEYAYYDSRCAINDNLDGDHCETLLVMKDDRWNYADCAGTYFATSRTFCGAPLYRKSLSLGHLGDRYMYKDSDGRWSIIAVSTFDQYSSSITCDYFGSYQRSSAGYGFGLPHEVQWPEFETVHSCSRTSEAFQGQTGGRRE